MQALRRRDLFGSFAKGLIKGSGREFVRIKRKMTLNVRFIGRKRFRRNFAGGSLHTLRRMLL